MQAVAPAGACCGMHGGGVETCGAEALARLPCAAAGPPPRHPWAPVRAGTASCPAGREVVTSPPCAAAGGLRLLMLYAPSLLQLATDGAEVVSSFLGALVVQPPPPPPPPLYPWVGQSASPLCAARSSASAGVSRRCPWASAQGGACI